MSAFTRRRQRIRRDSWIEPPESIIKEIRKVYRAVWVDSVEVEGARDGGRMEGVRYGAGRVVVRMYDFDDVEGFSAR